MFERVNLNGSWSLKEAPLSYKKESAGAILSDENGWYADLTVPFDVHMPLIDNGVIKDPVLADYCHDSEWIEQRSWWFKKTFSGSEINDSANVCRLTMEMLDSHADIFFNGEYLGHHESSHYPFIYDVKDFIQPGENVLLVRLTGGFEHVSDEDVAEIEYHVCVEKPNGRPDRGDFRRPFLRKPQYTVGWDWQPRIVTVAIGKDVYIDCYNDIAVNNLAAETLEIGETAKLRIHAEVELLDIYNSADADIEFFIKKDGEVKATVKFDDEFLKSGKNYITAEVEVQNAELWWPNGMGEQSLYELSANVTCRGKVTPSLPIKFGIRTIELNLDRTGDDTRNFMFVVNGKPIFAKGGNWVPADAIYARATSERYETLIKEAVNSNFNMLRIWGGGLYERAEFYDFCDKYGILVWQDFMFSTAAFPDHRESFRDLVKRELDYQTLRLRNRACVALFCGSNENHSMFKEWNGVPGKQRKQFGMKITNNDAPEHVRKNCDWIPYWNSSPYGGNSPSSYDVGDVHCWGLMFSQDMEYRINPKFFDDVNTRFASEYGYIGPVSRESIEEYFDGNPIERGGKIWNHHNNVFEKNTVAAGIQRHYTDKDLDLDEYIFYAGLVHGLILGYSLESFRSKHYCGGALFWMFNDCWGEMGWTTIDYYLRRKISFYGVKRAFDNVKLIMRENNQFKSDLIQNKCEINNEIRIFAANDTDKTISFNLKYGYISLDGKTDNSTTVNVTLPPFSRQDIITFDKGEFDIKNGVYYAIPDNDEIKPFVFRACDTKELNLCPAKLSIISETDVGSDKVIEIASETYSVGVHVEAAADFHMSDNYFDMLPGETRKVIVENGAGKEFAVKCVN